MSTPPTLQELLAAVARANLTSAEAAIVAALLSEPEYGIRSLEQLYRRYHTGGWYENGKLTPRSDFPPRTWLSRQGAYKAASALCERGLCSKHEYRYALKFRPEALLQPETKDLEATPVAPARSRENATAVANAGIHHGRSNRQADATPVVTRSRRHTRRRTAARPQARKRGAQ